MRTNMPLVRLITVGQTIGEVCCTPILSNGGIKPTIRRTIPIKYTPLSLIAFLNWDF